MSYILDALRKSEEQRRLASAPDLATEHRPAGTPRGRSARVLALVGAGLLLNALVIGAWLFWPRGDDPEDAAATGPAPTPAGQPTATRRVDTLPELRDRVERGTPAGVRSGPEPANPDARLPDAMPDPMPDPMPDRPATVPRDRDASVAIDTDRRTEGQSSAQQPGSEAPVPIRALPAEFQRRIGPLSFSTHIFADEPEFREVAINGRIHREGARVGALRLIEITEAGVILELEGRRFSVSVLQDWDY
mgnify:CR=1 FL=1